MTTVDILIRLTIMSEVHVQMMHFFFAIRILREADAVLFTLNWHSIVPEKDYFGEGSRKRKVRVIWRKLNENKNEP